MHRYTNGDGDGDGDGAGGCMYVNLQLTGIRDGTVLKRLCWAKVCYQVRSSLRPCIVRIDKEGKTVGLCS